MKEAGPYEIVCKEILVRSTDTSHLIPVTHLIIILIITTLFEFIVIMLKFQWLIDWLTFHFYSYSYS